MIDNVPSELLVPADPAEQASGGTLAKVGRQKQIETVAKSKENIVPKIRTRSTIWILLQRPQNMLRSGMLLRLQRAPQLSWTEARAPKITKSVPNFCCRSRRNGDAATNDAEERQVHPIAHCTKKDKGADYSKKQN